jgi:hypothetical protein
LQYRGRLSATSFRALRRVVGSGFVSTHRPRLSRSYRGPAILLNPTLTCLIASPVEIDEPQLVHIGADTGRSHTLHFAIILHLVKSPCGNLLFGCPVVTSHTGRINPGLYYRRLPAHLPRFTFNSTASNMQDTRLARVLVDPPGILPV